MTAPEPSDPTAARREPPRHTSRRTFLWSAGAAAAGGCVLLGSVADAAATVTLWRLDADWGHPVGPKQVTACRCAACHHHAANKVYFSEQSAIDGRIHPCCVCQPSSFTVPAATGDALLVLSADGASVDRRHDGVADALAAGAVPAPSGTPTAPTTPTTPTTPTAPPAPDEASSPSGSAGGESSSSTGDASTSAAAGGTVDADQVAGASGSTPMSTARPRSLAFTGTDSVAPIGLVALGTGAVLWGIGRRCRVADDHAVTRE